MHFYDRRLVSYFFVAIGFFGAGTVLADTNVAKSLITHDDPVVLPGIGRVLLAFVITAAAGVGMVYFLRKFKTKWFAQSKLANPVHIQSHTTVHSGLRLHVIEVKGNTVLLAEGKSGIAMTVISANASEAVREVMS